MTVQRTTRTYLRAVAVLLAAGSLVAADTQFLPVDEATRRPDFFSFRAALQRAIAQHDSAAVLAIVHPDIKNSFGGNDGIDEFRRMWRIEAPDSDIWATLGTVLALGGSFSGTDTFVAPYVFSRWPDRFEAFEHVAVIGSDVRVRSKPSVDAAVVSTVSFAILALDRRAETGEWTGVRLDRARTGYVASTYARSPVDYRAIFRRENRAWRLVTFVAGD
jgi:hypothetical protein